ncbi:RALF [Medicago truncatula]|uniref:RALF n=1 Tax=Medicago truncatula TaxID=3880 RepID=A0A072V808_MEDTR|nr:RALF [Medicago truncatula]
MSKAILSVFLSTLLIFSTFTQDVKASINGYPVVFGRKQLNAARIPANPYARGCEKINRCRGGNDPPSNK